MKTGLGLVVGLLVVGGWALGAPALDADTRFLFVTSVESVDHGTNRTKATVGEMTVWIGAKVARVDRGDEIVLFHEAPGTITWIDTKHSTFQRTTTPFDLTEVVPASQRSTVKSIERSLSNFASVTSRDGGTRGEWPTTIWTVVARQPDARARFTVESWVTEEITVNVRAYRDLLRWDAELNPYLRTWFSTVTGQAGVVVRRRSTYEAPDRKHVVTYQLVDVEMSAAVDPDRFAVPEGYEHIPLDGTRRMEARFR